MGCRNTSLAGEGHTEMWGIPRKFGVIRRHRQAESGELEHTCSLPRARPRKKGGSWWNSSSCDEKIRSQSEEAK